MATTRMPDSGLLKDNSHKAREEADKSENKISKGPVTKGTMRSRSLAMKFADVFFEGSFKDAIDYMVNDVAIPQIKNAIISGIEVLFNGGVGGSSIRRGGSGSTPYNSYYVGRDGSTRPNVNKTVKGGNASKEEISKIKKRFDPKLIVVEDRGQAQMALAALRNECNEFGQVGVDRLFDLVDIPSDWTSTTYGWVRGDLDDAKVRACGNGWWFDVPDPYPID